MDPSSAPSSFPQLPHFVFLALLDLAFWTQVAEIARGALTASILFVPVVVAGYALSKLMHLVNQLHV